MSGAVPILNPPGQKSDSFVTNFDGATESFKNFIETIKKFINDAFKTGMVEGIKALAEGMIEIIRFAGLALREISGSFADAINIVSDN